LIAVGFLSVMQGVGRRMEELVGEALAQMLERALGRVTLLEPAYRALDFMARAARLVRSARILRRRVPIQCMKSSTPASMMASLLTAPCRTSRPPAPVCPDHPL
jgi:hypothetical protein